MNVPILVQRIFPGNGSEHKMKKYFKRKSIIETGKPYDKFEIKNRNQKAYSLNIQSKFNLISFANCASEEVEMYFF